MTTLGQASSHSCREQETTCRWSPWSFSPLYCFGQPGCRWPFAGSRKARSGKERCLSLILKASETERDKEETIGNELGDGLTISRRCWGEILERFIYAVDVMVTEGRDPTF